MYIDIAFSLNQAIYLSLLTAINSIIKNTPKIEQVRFNIVVPPQEIAFFREKIDEAFPNQPFALRIEEFTPSEVIKQYLNSKYREQYAARRMSRNMQFARFFLGDIFPGLTKVIYLDTDLVVLKDIAELFNAVQSFSAKQYFAGVPHGLPPILHFTKPIAVLDELQQMKKTFNSGVFLTDFSYWNQATYSKLNYYLDLEGKYNYRLYKVGDETILNLMFKDFIPLDRDWNRSGYGNCRLIASLLRCDLERAGVIHWSGGYHKPWNTPNIIYAELWNHYNPENRGTPTLTRVRF